MTNLSKNKLSNFLYVIPVDKLTKLNTKSLKYRNLEFDLTTFYQLVNGETTINLQIILEPYKNNSFILHIMELNTALQICHNFNNSQIFHM